MAEPDDRRTIDELLTLYEHEPTVRDLFVEGNSDKSVVEWFLDEVGINDVAVYEISTVSVPYDEVRKRSLEDNNRGRVIALAFALHSRSNVDLTNSVGCIADTDFDHLLQKEYECPLLIFTVFTSLELYLFNSSIITKFMRLFVRNFRRDADRIFHAFTPVLTELFLIRLANQELGLGIEPLPLAKCCKLVGNRIDFNETDYIHKYLSKGARLKEHARFTETVEMYRTRVVGDPRTHIHGHDFIDLLILYVTGIKKPKRAYQHDLFARSLFGTLELRYVESEPLFVELKSRFA